MQDPLISALLAAALVAMLSIIAHRQYASMLTSKIQKQLDLTNEAERQIHHNELKYLADRNSDEITHSKALGGVRLTAFEEGKKQGRAEMELETAIKIADQRSEFAVRLLTEKEQAASEARDRQRAEHELQAKLFSIKISPYVQLITDNGVFKNTHEGKIGYQYQLLVNGIPAFQPHVVIERHEKVAQVDQSIKQTLLAIAQNCAEAAVSTYLGASPQFAKLSPSVLEQIEK